VNAVALEAAVPQDPPVLQPRQGVFHPRSRPAVDCIFRLLLRAEVRLTASFAVRDEQTGALVSAVGDGRCAAAGPVDTGLRKGPAVVAAAGQRVVPCSGVVTGRAGSVLAGEAAGRPRWGWR
jgi:hypothetical protein